MPYKRLRYNLTTMFVSLKPHLVLSLVVLVLLFLPGCFCQPCLHPTLSETFHPVLSEVTTVPFDKADYGITDKDRKAIMTNIGAYYFALEECNTTIRLYNKTVSERPQ